MLMPYATSVAAATIVFAMLFGRDFGLINWFFGLFGVDPIDWENGRWSSQIAISTIVTWRWTGYNALIYLAAIAAIPKDLYEAAAVDGASTWQRLIHITIPLLRPTTFFLFITGIIGAFQIFTEVYIMTNGGPLNRTTTIGYYLYINAFREFEMGYATAMAFVLFAMIFVFTLIQWKYTRGDVEY